MIEIEQELMQGLESVLWLILTFGSPFILGFALGTIFFLVELIILAVFFFIKLFRTKSLKISLMGFTSFFKPTQLSPEEEEALEMEREADAYRYS